MSQNKRKKQTTESFAVYPKIDFFGENRFLKLILKMKKLIFPNTLCHHKQLVNKKSKKYLKPFKCIVYP